MDLMKNLTQDFYKMMEIYFDKVIAFPYMFLNEIQETYMGEYDDCNIYMLMLRDKLEVEKLSKKRDYLLIKYRNISSKKKRSVKLYYRDILGVDIKAEYIGASIDKFGEVVRIEIESNFFNMLRQLRGIPSNVPNVFILNIYDVIGLLEREEETCDEFEVIYIGQSNPEKEYRTIFDRLRKHEKVTQIFREYNLEYRDKELMVYILHTKTKLYNVDGFLFLGSSEWKDSDKIGDKIDNDALIDLAEAMLIYHFKPQYNIKFKDSLPNLNQKVYKKLAEAGLNAINLGLNLYLQTLKNRITLITQSQKTTTKFRILKCNIDSLYYDKEGADITYEDISDERYMLLQ